METLSPDNSASEKLTRYLLGEMSEAEQMELEVSYFADPQMFAELCASRNNLIDSYVAGGLSPSLRGRFEAGIEKSWAMNERIRFAETLQEAIDARGATPVLRRHITASGSMRAFAANHRGAILAACALLMILGAGWVVIRIRPHQAANNEEDGLQNSAPAPFASNRGASPSPESPVNGSAETSDAAATLKPNPVLAVTLTPDVGRSASDATRGILIPQETVIVHLLLIVDRPQDLDYRGVLTTFEGARVFETGQLKAHANETGRAVELFVPANRLSDGDYVVRLSGVTAGNKLSSANYYFHVRNR